MLPGQITKDDIDPKKVLRSAGAAYAANTVEIKIPATTATPAVAPAAPVTCCR